MARHILLKEVKPEHQFILKTGERIKSLKELASKLERMSDDVFYHHVNDAKNDFRNWINDIVKDKPLADALGSLIRKHDIISAVNSRINEVDKRKRVVKADVKKKSNNVKELKNKADVVKELKKRHIEVVRPMTRGEWVGNKMNDLAIEIAAKVNEMDKTRKQLIEKTDVVSGINDFFLGLVIGLLLGILLARVLVL